MPALTCGGELSGVWRFHQADFPTPPTPPQLDECSGLQLFRFDGQLEVIGWFNDRPAQRHVTLEFAPDGTYTWQQVFQGPISVHYPAACRMTMTQPQSQETCEDIAAAASLAWTDPDQTFGPAVAAQVTCTEDANGGCDCTVNLDTTKDELGFWETGADGSLILSKGAGRFQGAQLTSYCVEQGTLRFADSVLWWWPDFWGLEFSKADCAVEAVPECQPSVHPAPAAEVSCGGNAAGEWYAVQEDLPTVIPPQLDECLGLTLQRGTSSLGALAWMPTPADWRMHLIVSTEGTYSAAVSWIGPIELSYPATCLVSDVQEETCADVGAALSVSWMGEGVLVEPLSCSATADGTCNCSGTLISTGGRAGSWVMQETGQVTLDGQGLNGIISFATTYCVAGDTLRFNGDSSAWWRGSSGVELTRVICDDGQQGPFEQGPDCGGPCSLTCPP
jgi:hypothetical protein